MKGVFRWFATFLLVVVMAVPVFAKAPKKGGVKAKFYDFSDMVIDGEIKRPNVVYTDARQAAKFERLLKLKKSFLQPMFQTAKEDVFK